MALNDIAVEAEGLSRTYVKFRKPEGLLGSLRALFIREKVLVEALKDFSIRISRGEILGLIGPNGAGKTTFVKILSGIIQPSGGKVRALGFDPSARPKDYLRRIAVVMGQRSQLWQDLPARDSFKLAKAVYDIDDRTYKRSLERLLSCLGAQALIDLPVRGLSLGERMKMEFACAMLHEPDLALLDEPTIGLDAPAQKAIREFIRAENADRGMTVILTSHYMEDVLRLCPRIAVVVKGRKTHDGPANGLFTIPDGVEETADIVEGIYARGASE
jgi:ABC-2 type transport system ATP-binding protein